MTARSRDVFVEMLDWRGFLIEVRYEPAWLGCDFAAHLQLETLEPARAALPVTETGYRSHFTDRQTVDTAGGPAAFVVSWLDSAANTRRWADSDAAQRQFSLF